MISLIAASYFYNYKYKVHPSVLASPNPNLSSIFRVFFSKICEWRKRQKWMKEKGRSVWVLTSSSKVNDFFSRFNLETIWVHFRYFHPHFTHPHFTHRHHHLFFAPVIRLIPPFRFFANNRCKLAGETLTHVGAKLDTCYSDTKLLTAFSFWVITFILIIL